VNPDMDVCTEIQNHRKALQKMQIYNNLLKTKRTPNPEV